MGKKQPRHYQQEAHDLALQHMREASQLNKVGKFVIDAAPATGKTLTMAMSAGSIASKGGRVMILSYQPVLCKQNFDESWEWGTVTSLYASKFSSKQTTGAVIVGTVGTVVNALSTDFKNTRVDALLIDECHQVPYDEDNSQFMQVIKHFEDNSKRLGSKRPMQIIGMTGSPFRNIDSIVGGAFWGKTIYSIGIEKATEEGFLTPPVYGYPDEDDETLDFSSIDTKSGSWEFDEKALDEIVMSGAGKERLVRILTEVKIKTADRNQIIIFASTKRHAAEVKRVLLALGEKESMIGLVTDDTPERERDDAIDKSKAGELRWLINVSCLTTGFDSPLIDTVLFLRPVGSLTLLVQCLGRAARLLKDWMIERGYVKPNYLVLDYAGVFDRLGHLLDSPIINDAELARSKEKDETIQYCPVCHEENGLKARRCRGKSANEPDGRCGHFFGKSIECPKCMTKNDVTAQVCRSCSHELIDPNRKLLNKAYTDDEMVPVIDMKMSIAKGGAIKVEYITSDLKGHGHPHEIWGGLNGDGFRLWRDRFLIAHVENPGWRNKLSTLHNPKLILTHKNLFRKPKEIAYRINENGFFVVGRKRF
ncbi:MAG: DEAD/DEAH box helicase [Aeromonadaceae bacterium]